MLQGRNIDADKAMAPSTVKSEYPITPRDCARELKKQPLHGHQVSQWMEAD